MIISPVGLFLAGRVLKKPKLGDGRRLQVEAIQLLEQHQDLSSLFQEVVVSEGTFLEKLF